MLRIRGTLLILALILVTTSSHAHAYIGPGLGAGIIGAIIGLIGAIFLAIIGLFWYPIKRLIKSKRGGADQKTRNNEQ